VTVYLVIKAMPIGCFPFHVSCSRIPSGYLVVLLYQPILCTIPGLLTLLCFPSQRFFLITIPVPNDPSFVCRRFTRF
jgi:hypothetical protein